MKNEIRQEARLHNVIDSDKWLQAIEDYKLRVSQYRRNIRKLQRSIRLFKENAERGMPWPGSKK